MAHQDAKFMHERAKASLDSLVIDKWNADMASFLHDMAVHKRMPEPQFYVYVQQYIDEPPPPNPLFHPLPSELPSFGDPDRHMKAALASASASTSAQSSSSKARSLGTSSSSLAASSANGDGSGNKGMSTADSYDEEEESTRGPSTSTSTSSSTDSRQDKQRARPLNLLPGPMKPRAPGEEKSLLNTPIQPLFEASSVVKVLCTSNTTIAELKQLYYIERIKARKRRAKEIFDKRLELDLGTRKATIIREQEEKARIDAGADYVDPLNVVLPEEIEQCCYEWGFLTMDDFDIAEQKREERAIKGKFVPARPAVVNFRHGGVYLKDYHTLAHYRIPAGGQINHTRRFPDPAENLLGNV